MRNRSVLEIVRSYLKTMNVPNVLWGEAVNHAIYVLNRVSTKALKDATPYEMWTGRKPHVGHLRVFGCTTHMKIAKNHLDKLEDRSKRVVDVVFKEDQTWNWEKTTKIKAIPGMSFTIEGLDLNEFQEEKIDPEPYTPQNNHESSYSNSN
nr:retrotransposon protein, putative, unclassified [Tanacetum cinerariifolium]